MAREQYPKVTKELLADVIALTREFKERGTPFDSIDTTRAIVEHAKATLCIPLFDVARGEIEPAQLLLL